MSIIGKKFGHLTVIEYDHTNDKYETFWRCRCDCGSETIVRRSNLQSGTATTCGSRVHRMEDLSGRTFGRLTVICFDHIDLRHESNWLCKCDCGNETVVTRDRLLRGVTRSCGCYHRDRTIECNTTHGLRNTKIYNVWDTMIRRCENKNNQRYHRYGGRGITVCDEWHRFENFYEWAMNNGYESGLTLDRINNDDGYYPENCRWIDNTAQQNNKSNNHYITYNGITHSRADWSRILNVNYETLRFRILRGDMRDFEVYFNEN